jgi:hypothetical protein
MTTKPASGAHHGSPNGPTRVNDVSVASVTSTTTSGTSVATSVVTLGTSAPDERRSDAIRSAKPISPLTMFPTKPMLAARYSGRRPTVPPAARTLRYHASLRATSEPMCSTAAAPSNQPDAPTAASANARQRPASTAARTMIVTSVPAAVTSLR